MFDKGKP